MKKLLARLTTVMIIAIFSVMNVVSAQQSFLKQNLKNAPELPWLNSKQSWSWWNNGIYTINDTEANGVDRFIGSIVKVINWVLGLLAIIALVILIYTGVKMLINSSDDKAIDEWYKTVKNIFIALLFIGVSWLIVQWIFYVIKLIVG